MGHSRVALALSVIFILCGFYTTLPLPFLGFLALILSSSFSFFQKTRPSMDSEQKLNSTDSEQKLSLPNSSMGSEQKLSPPNEVEMENEEAQQEKRQEDVAEASAIRDGEQDITLNSLEVESDLLQIELLDGPDPSSECSSETISDDESLIEISLPDGDNAEDYSEPVFEEGPKGEFIWDFLPESVFKQSGLMELLSELNEEDNMIEIDITRGSIKCANLGIMA